ncbi:MAG: tetratricopeptide repeat protein, partial [Eubacteriales bacterium]
MKKVILLSILFIFLVGCSRYNKKGIEKNDLGLDYYSDNNLEKALELFIEASEEEHIPMYFINQGVVLIDLKEYKKSLKAFEEAININDGSLEEAYFGSGIASMYLGKYEEALDYFELTLDEKPDYLEGYLHKARVEQKIGKVEKVINTYNKALEIFP